MVIGQQVQSKFTETGSELNNRRAQPLFCDALHLPGILNPSHSHQPIYLHSTADTIQATTLHTLINRCALNTSTQKPHPWRQESGVRHVL
jgi:hypothetical protein